MDAAGAGGVPTCYRHSDRETYISCQRCERPVCPDCMRDAAVGFQCPDCVARGARETRQGLTPYGGRRSGNPALTSMVLVGLNLAVWLVVLATGGNRSPLYFLLALRPRGSCFAAGYDGYYPGVPEAGCGLGDGTAWVEGITDGAVWQVVSSAFLHVDVWHVAMNVLMIWFLGPQLEAVLGRARFLGLYAASALGGSAAVMLLSAPESATFGASGAVFGMVGALLVAVHKVGGNLQMLLLWLVISVVYGFTADGISWQGHLGGFVAGAATGAALLYAPRARRAPVQWGAVAAVCALSLALVAARALAIG